MRIDPSPATGDGSQTERHRLPHPAIRQRAQYKISVELLLSLNILKELICINLIVIV